SLHHPSSHSPIYTLSLHDALPISFLTNGTPISVVVAGVGAFGRNHARVYHQLAKDGEPVRLVGVVDADLARADAVAKEFNCRALDRKSTRLNSSHEWISYAVFCLK